MSGEIGLPTATPGENPAHPVNGRLGGSRGPRQLSRYSDLL